MNFHVRKIRSATPGKRRSERPVFSIRSLAGQYIRGQLPLWVSGPVTLGLVILIVLIISLWRRPLPERNGNFLILRGKVSRAIVTEKHSDRKNRLTGIPYRPGIPYLPHHLTFKSSKHRVDIYVFRQDTGNPTSLIADMLRLTEQLEQGVIPQNTFARGSGMRGRIPLYHRPWGWTQMLVLIHAAHGDTTVELKTHYAP